MSLYAEARDGALISYDVHGGGRPGVPVLFVHGFAADAAVTWEQTGWLRALGDRPLVTMDLRGHGASDKPTDADAYAPIVQGADLLAVLDSAGVDEVDVVAYSMGTRVASALGEIAPERIRRVVLGGTGPIERFATWDIAEVERMLHGGDPAEDRITRAVLRRALEAGNDPEAMLACVRGMTGAPLIAPGDAPVLFVAGELDDVTEGARQLAEDWSAHYVSIPGRDHINVLTARAYKDTVVDFLA
ncbi:alpha/beta fold hydrolase [Glaciibacter flavus]|uniref:alpha/beta fold hydrolase n=1 Tax=Orlajensenia flava TaxID=2565934 RepID=UPI001455D3C8|nr:alpha/beta hydrolase [Glaciibacter flavus]